MNIRVCAAPGCSVGLEGRSHAKTCSSACRQALYDARKRQEHPHPYRDTPQYKQMRDMWADRTGGHWADRGDEEW